MITLSNDQKRWLKYVYFLFSNQDFTATNWYDSDFNSAMAEKVTIAPAETDNYLKVNKAIQRIAEVISTGAYENIDEEIRIASRYALFWDKVAQGYKGCTSHFIAKTLAYMCVLNKVKFDPDGDYTTFEKAQFDKTLLGAALLEAEAENNSPDPQPNTATTPTTPQNQGQSQGQSTSTGPSAPPHANVPSAGNYINGKPSVHSRSTAVKKVSVPVDPNDPSKGTMLQRAKPKNTYKSEGPKSPECFDIKSTPLVKEKMSGDQGYLFVIAAEDSTTTANKPLAFINPLKDTKTYRNNSTNIVKLGSAHGYSDLPIYFNTIAEANAFIVKMANAGKIENKYTNVRVEKRNIGTWDKYFSHDFYLIGSDLGDVYVCAYRLNEDLDKE